MSTGETSGLAFADAHASKAMAFRREKAGEAVLDIAPRPRWPLPSCRCQLRQWVRLSRPRRPGSPPHLQLYLLQQLADQRLGS